MPNNVASRQHAFAPKKERLRFQLNVSVYRANVYEQLKCRHIVGTLRNQSAAHRSQSVLDCQSKQFPIVTQPTVWQKYFFCDFSEFWKEGKKKNTKWFMLLKMSYVFSLEPTSHLIILFHHLRRQNRPAAIKLGFFFEKKKKMKSVAVSRHCLRRRLCA